MRILIVSNYYFPELGAAPGRITNLAEGLSELGHHVEVLCPIPNYPKGEIFEDHKGKIVKHEIINNIPVHRYWIYPSVSQKALIRILSMFSFAFSLWLFGTKRRLIVNFDVVIIQNSPLLVSMSSILLLKKIYRKKIVLNISDLWPLSALELGAIKRGRFYSFLEWVEKFNYNNSHLIVGQSNEILEHVKTIVSKPDFLYRNVPKISFDHYKLRPSNQFRIIYAGLLGVAQGVFDMITHINFRKLETELHIYGHGNEKEKIEKYIEQNPESNIYYHGSLSKSELHKILPEFQASIVPLKNRIHGAVPSKIFELAKAGIPILFCGGGEGAKIVEKFNLGLSSEPTDFEDVSDNIKKLVKLTPDEYNNLKKSCIETANHEFDFANQLRNFENELKKIVQPIDEN